MTSDKINILVIDDDPIVRSSLATILVAAGEIAICGEGGNGREAVQLYAELNPDILLMDIQMPICSGIEAAGEILGSCSDARIVLLTTFSDDEYIVSALRLGVRGYLIKQDVARIAPALKAVMAGQIVLGDEVVERVANFGAPTPKAALRCDEQLTGRELDIITLIAQGMDNKEIASRLSISEGTLRNHVSTMLQKLQLKNRTQLAVYYYKNLQ